MSSSKRRLKNLQARFRICFTDISAVLNYELDQGRCDYGRNSKAIVRRYKDFAFAAE